MRPNHRAPVVIKNLHVAALALAGGEGVDVHGAPARGFGMHTNGHLGADLLHVKAGDQFPVHTHPGDHLLLCLAGRGTITVDQVTYDIIPGDLYMVNGLIPHAVGAITNHVILAIGAPHKAVDSPERMAFVDWAGHAVEVPISASETARPAGAPL
jgi:quercetin dioxygenase-like cupin family protein